MKMKWFDRIVLVLVMLCMLAVSVALIGIALGVLNQPVEQLYSVMTNGLWVNSLILIVIGAVLILMVIRVLYASCGGHHGGAVAPATVLLKTTDNGTIRIALSAVDTLVQRCVRSSASVRDVASHIGVDEHDALEIRLRISFAPETVLQEATVQIQNDVCEYVQTHTGVPVQGVQILIDAVGSGQNARVE